MPPHRAEHRSARLRTRLGVAAARFEAQRSRTPGSGRRSRRPCGPAPLMRRHRVFISRDYAPGARAQQHGRREPAYNRASVLHARIHPYPFHARASSVVLCVRVAEAPPPAAFRGVAYWREYSTMRSVCARRCARRTYSKRSRARRGLCTAWCGAALSMAATKGVAQRTGAGPEPEPEPEPEPDRCRYGCGVLGTQRSASRRRIALTAR